MEVVETVKLKNLPQDIKLVESALSSAHGDFRVRNPECVLNYIEVKFVGGTPSQEIVRELK